MKNLVNDFQLIKEAEATVLRELAIEVATKEGARSTNRNSKLGLAICYLLTSMMTTDGSTGEITREAIELATSVSKTDAKESVNKLEKKGLVVKYKKVNQIVDKRGKLTSKFRFDKYAYTLVATEELYDLVSSKGYNIPFDKASLRDLHTQAASEVEKLTTVKKTVNGVNVDEIFTTNARGERVKETKVDIQSAEQAKAEAAREYEQKLAAIQAVEEQDGKVEELSTVQPLVSQENILAMDMEEFQAEQQEAVIESEEDVEALLAQAEEEDDFDFDFLTIDEEPETDSDLEIEFEEEFVAVEEEVEESIEPQPEVEEAQVTYHNNQVKRVNGRKLTSRKQGTLDGYGNARKARNLGTENNEDLVKALKWKEKIESGEWNERNLKPDQIVRIYTTWQELNNGFAPTSIEKLYTEVILGFEY